MQILVPVLAVFLVLLGAYFAWKDDMLWPSEDSGLTFLGHAGMWCDLLLMPIAFYFAMSHWNDWIGHPIWLLVIAATSVAVTYGLHRYWAKSLPQCPTLGCRSCHLQGPNEILPCGWVHVVYMSLALTVFGAYYCLSEGSRVASVPNYFLLVTIPLVFTVVIGTLQPMLFFRNLYRRTSIVTCACLCVIGASWCAIGVIGLRTYTLY